MAPAPAFDLRLDRHPLDGGVMDAGLEDYRAYGPVLDDVQRRCGSHIPHTEIGAPSSTSSRR